MKAVNPPNFGLTKLGIKKNANIDGREYRLTQRNLKKESKECRASSLSTRIPLPAKDAKFGLTSNA